MGNSSSSFTVLTQDILEEYAMLSYLNKAEIQHLYKIISTLDANGQLHDLHFRFPAECIESIFPQLQHNPFKDRIFRVFSSFNDGRLSFTDMLDLCSVMSDKCPDDVKATWAFRIFDFDEDKAIGEDDLKKIIDRLTNGSGTITEEEKKHIIETLLKDIDLESNGSIGQLEFQHAVGKMSEFSSSFCFRL